MKFMVSDFEIVQIWTEYVRLGQICPYVCLYKTFASNQITKKLRCKKTLMKDWKECISFSR